MNKQDFRRILKREDVPENAIEKAWEWLNSYGHTSTLLKWTDEDVLRIAAARFNSDLEERKHVCGAHGFGLSENDYCPPCVRGSEGSEYDRERRETVKKDFRPALFVRNLNQLFYCKDLGLGIYSASMLGSKFRVDLVSEKKERYKRLYGLN